MRAVKVELFPGLAARSEGNNIGTQENSALAKRLLELALHPLTLVEPSTFAVTNFITNRPTQKSRPSFISAAKQFLLSITTVFTNRPAGESQPSFFSAAMQLLGFSVTKRTRINALTLELEKLEERLLQFSNRSEKLNLAHSAQCSPLLQKASDLATRLSEIPAMREEALKQLQVKHTEAALDKFLERFLIRRIKIPGIGEARLAALLSAGITTAADVREDAVKNVTWFGAASAAKLLEWRRQCETQFKFDPASPLPDPLRSKINDLVRSNLSALVAKGKSLESDFNRITAAYSKDFGRLQQEFEAAFKERAAVQAELAALTAS
jgi:DNA-binding helix-hairpin-helix protein with protein kinase domain